MAGCCGDHDSPHLQCVFRVVIQPGRLNISVAELIAGDSGGLSCIFFKCINLQDLGFKSLLHGVSLSVPATDLWLDTSGIPLQMISFVKVDTYAKFTMLPPSLVRI